ncbi:MAG: hypothetical protein ABR567_11390, partial [Myxococcales bacterium]
MKRSEAEQEPPAIGERAAEYATSRQSSSSRKRSKGNQSVASIEDVWLGCPEAPQFEPLITGIGEGVVDRPLWPELRVLARLAKGEEPADPPPKSQLLLGSSEAKEALRRVVTGWIKDHEAEIRSFLSDLGCAFERLLQPVQPKPSFHLRLVSKDTEHPLEGAGEG